MCIRGPPTAAPNPHVAPPTPARLAPVVHVANITSKQIEPVPKPIPPDVNLKNYFGGLSDNCPSPCSSPAHWAPSDDTAASGGSDAVQAVNEEWGIFPYAGGSPTYTTSFTQWFQVAAGNSNTGFFDPHVEYDYSGSHYVMVVDDYHSMWLQASEGSTGSSTWCYVQIPLTEQFAQSGDWADYPLLGVDSHYIYISYNEFDSSNNFVRANLLVITKNIETCVGTVYYNYTYSGLTDPGTGLAGTNLLERQAFSVDPADEYSEPAAGEYMVDSYALESSSCDVSLWTVNGSSISNVNVSGTQVVMPECYNSPNLAVQPGAGSPPVDTNDTRISQAEYENGLLYFSLTSAYQWSSANTKDIVEYMELNPVSDTLPVYGGYGSTNAWWWFPAFGTESTGAGVVVSAYSSATVDPSVVVAGITSTGSVDALDYYLVQGTTPYVDTYAYNDQCQCERWGDYFSSYTVAGNPSSVWVTGQDPTNSGYDWGTELGVASE